MHPSDSTPQQTAEAVREQMLACDAASRAMGMAVTAIAPGRSTVLMRVRDDMLNGHALCHGGFISTLADSAFAFACNSYGDLTVASGFSIDFMAPGRAGDTLSADCAEVSRAGRTGVYDVRVTNQHGALIAVFRGRSYTLKGKPAIGS